MSSDIYLYILGIKLAKNFVEVLIDGKPTQVRNAFAKGGKHEEFSPPGSHLYKLEYVPLLSFYVFFVHAYSRRFSYAYDSPPDGLKHLVIWEFSLVPLENMQKKRKLEKDKLPGIVHTELRIFLVAPSKNSTKRRIAQAEQVSLPHFLSPPYKFSCRRTIHSHNGRSRATASPQRAKFTSIISMILIFSYSF